MKLVQIARPLTLIDLFCGAGGAAEGYRRAGFTRIIGVDIAPQPNYPFEFIQADAMEFMRHNVFPADAYHASPPCQAHTDLQKQNKREYPDLIAPVRAALRATGRPYVIENVEGAPLLDPIRICGAGLAGLRVIRHRLFESNVPLQGVSCPERHPLVFTHDKRKAHYGLLDQNTAFVQVTGGGNATVENKAAAMGIGWMSGRELNESIPPVYAEHIGRQMIAHAESAGLWRVAA